MVGVEIDLVVQDSIKSLAFYNEVFGIETLEISNYDKGLNEAIFNLYGTRFHLLDENLEYQLIAPRAGDSSPIWINVVVKDIKGTLRRALALGGLEVQELVEMPEMGISNAIFKDPSGHLWMLHEIDRPVSAQERTDYLEGKFGPEN